MPTLHTLLIVALVIIYRAYTAPVVAPPLTSFTEQRKIRELKDTTGKYYHNLLEREHDEVHEPAVFLFPPIPTTSTTVLTSPVILAGTGTSKGKRVEKKSHNSDPFRHLLQVYYY